MRAVFDGAFDGVPAGRRAVLELAGGQRIELAVHRWHAVPDAGDEVLLARCTGPVLDLGCGPGRLTGALTGRGVTALGVDNSEVAVRLTRQRGGAALCRDLFDRLPGEGRWRQVLLADGNIGIGGDPVRLLRRAAALLDRDGTVLVETEAAGVGCDRHAARLSTSDGSGPWFPWARLGIDAVAEPAAQAGLRVLRRTRHGNRWFAELARGRELTENADS